MVKTCEVCGLKKSSDTKQSFHKFPANKATALSWCKAVHLEMNNLTKNSVICSDHFLPNHVFYGSACRTVISKMALPVLPANDESTTTGEGSEGGFRMISPLEDLRNDGSGKPASEGSEGTLSESMEIYSSSSTNTASEALIEVQNLQRNRLPKKRFPNDTEKCRQWLTNMHIKDWTPKQKNCLRSKHFEERWFYKTDSQHETRLLNGAVPTITELPTYLQAKESKKSPSVRRVSREAGPSTMSAEVVPELDSLRKKLFREVCNSKDCPDKPPLLEKRVRPCQNLSQKLCAEEKSLLLTKNWQEIMKNGSFESNDSIEEIICRTCMEATKDGLPFNFTCFEEHSIKDAIGHVIPELLPYLKDEDQICRKCFDILNTVLTFVENCLRVNKLLLLMEVSDKMSFSENEAEKSFNIAFKNRIGTVQHQKAVPEKENGRALNGLPPIRIYLGTKGVEYQEDDAISINSKVECSITQNNEGTEEIKSKAAGVEENCGINVNGKINRPSLIQDNKGAVDVERRHGNIMSNGKCTMFSSSYIHEDASVISISGINEVIKACTIAEGLGVPIIDKSTQYSNKRILFIGNKTVWTCPICSATFNMEATLQQHFVGQHKLSKAHLLTLKRYFYKKNASKCLSCLQPFKTIKQKNKHIENCSVFNCPYCDELVSMDNLTAHTTARHADRKPFKCFTCRLEFESYKLLVGHIFRKDDKSNPLGKLTCRVCKCRVERKNYKEHFNNHKTYHCKTCSKKFTNKVSLRTHQREHKAESTLCPVCGKIFVAAGLDAHIRTAHEVNKERDVLCHMCCKQFTTVFTLKRHIQTVHNLDTFNCELCGKIFKHRHSLTRHYRLVHERITRHTCFICGKQFPRSDYYNNHMRVAHTKKDKVKRAKPSSANKCKYCGLVYNCSSNRIRHEKLHKNNPNYIFRCNVCWKTCSSQEMLDMHCATHKINFHCPLCGKPFGRKFALKTHLSQEHNGEKISELKNMSRRQSDITFQKAEVENHGYGSNEHTASDLQIFVYKRS